MASKKKLTDLTGDGVITQKDVLRGRGVPGFSHGGMHCSPRKEMAGAITMPKKNVTNRRS